MMAIYDIKIDYLSQTLDTQYYTINADTEDKAISEATQRLYRDFDDDYTKVANIEKVEVVIRPPKKYYSVSVCIVEKKSEVIEINHYFDFYITKHWNTSDNDFAIRLQKEIEFRADIYAKKHNISNYEIKRTNNREATEEEYSYSMSCTI